MGVIRGHPQISQRTANTPGRLGIERNKWAVSCPLGGQGRSRETVVLCPVQRRTHVLTRERAAAGWGWLPRTPSELQFPRVPLLRPGGVAFSSTQIKVPATPTARTSFEGHAATHTPAPHPGPRTAQPPPGWRGAHAGGGAQRASVETDLEKRGPLFTWENDRVSHSGNPKPGGITLTPKLRSPRIATSSICQGRH